MTDRGGGGQYPTVGVPEPQATELAASSSGRRLRAVSARAHLTLADVYRQQLDFVVRTTRHLGVPEPQVEDVVHDVFLVVHRRLSEYDGRAPLRAWLYGITRRVVLHHKRAFSRAKAREVHVPVPRPSPGAEETIARHQAAQAVRTCLADLDDDQRMVFVLADIEGLSAPEIATAQRIKLNTVYSRLRLGRKKIERALARVLGDGGDGKQRP